MTTSQQIHDGECMPFWKLLFGDISTYVMLSS